MNAKSVVQRCATHALQATMYLALVLGFAVPAGSKNKANLDEFAKCLASKNAAMYGSFWCQHCDEQKELFGDSFKHVPYVECSIPGSRQMTFTCQLAQIRHTPTWIFADGGRLVGVQQLKTLSEKTGCSLP